MPRLPIALFLIAFLATACSGGSHASSTASPPPAPTATPTLTPTPVPTPTPAPHPEHVAAAPVLRPVPLLSAPAATPAPSPSVNLPGIVTAAPSPAPRRSVSAPAVKATAVAAAPAENPNLPPRIVEVSLSESTVHSGDRVLGQVRTSLNTASVEARLGGYSLSLRKVGAGTFVIAYHVPWVPFFLHGHYDILLIARNTAGTQTRRLIPIQFQ